MNPHAPPLVDRIPIAVAADLIEVRRRVTAAAQTLDFGLVEETKLITAASELTRNILQVPRHTAGCCWKASMSRRAMASG